MAKRGRKKKKPIESYAHADKERPNNPPVGLVTPETDADAGDATAYAHDPHLDPQLQWAGKAEHASFEVPVVSLHVHEQVDPCAIIEAVRKRSDAPPPQGSLFAAPEENPPLREAIEFYSHSRNWSNRLVAGDSLLVMNSLLEKEGMGGKVQMVYVDPPYGIRYGSNFQPFVNKSDVKDGKDADLTQEPETIRAFRDTWELGIHSWLAYLRDRLLLARELLTESGSCFVQIGDENVHLARCVMDEVFGTGNALAMIAFKKKSFTSTGHAVNDYILHYAKKKEHIKLHSLYRAVATETDPADNSSFRKIRTLSGALVTPASPEEAKNLISQGGKWCQIADRLISQHQSNTRSHDIVLRGQKISPGSNAHWALDPELGIPRLEKAGRLHLTEKGRLYGYVFLDDLPRKRLTNFWDDTASASHPIYVVQTADKVLERCILMTTEPGDLVFDPTCGSGTTAYAAEKWGRRWITCDTSRVATTLARQRLMTATFYYYKLAHPDEGVGSGFACRKVPHISLRDIANNAEIDGVWREHHERMEPLRKRLNAALGASLEEWEIPREAVAGWPAEVRALHRRYWELRVRRQRGIDAAIARDAPQETLYDQPLTDRTKARVTGPFTVEAVPAPTVRSLEEVEETAAERAPADASVARSGETARQGEWRDELYETGIRGEGGERLSFTRLEPLSGTRRLHADGEIYSPPPPPPPPPPPDRGRADAAPEETAAASRGGRCVVSFGPEYAPLEQRQVARAIEEAGNLVPRPKFIVFAAFQFDPEAAKDIDATNWPGVTLLKAWMNADLLTKDLKKKRASSESFWLIGQPDVEVERVAHGADAGKYRVRVCGFDYYNIGTGKVESGGTNRIAMWMLDPDYDGRSLFPRQVLFPMADGKRDWTRLAKSLRAEIDAHRLEAYRGAQSLPFEAGEHRRAAVKIIDDRGIESLKIVEVDAG